MLNQIKLNNCLIINDLEFQFYFQLKFHKLYFFFVFYNLVFYYKFTKFINKRLQSQILILQLLTKMNVEIFNWFKINKVFIPFLIIYLSNAQPTFSDNCAVWNANDGVCSQCNPGFYLQFFFCVPCSPNCICSSKHDYCQSCMILPYNGLNYHSILDQEINQCLLCNTSMPYCLECTNLHMCTKCWNGQYLVQQKNLDGVVTKQYCSQNLCQQNCQFCQNQFLCKQCQPGFYLFANKTCSSNPCTSNCTICNSLTSCLNCSPGYYLNGTQCAVCSMNCTTCLNGVSCQTCAPQYALQNGTCINTNISNCIQYGADFTICTGCQQGYEVTAAACNQCTGCNVCTQQFICLSPCLPGYQPFNFACIPSFQQKLIVIGSILMIFIFLIY